MPTYVSLASSVIALCGKNRPFEASSNKKVIFPVSGDIRALIVSCCLPLDMGSCAGHQSRRSLDLVSGCGADSAEHWQWSGSVCRGPAPRVATAAEIQKAASGKWLVLG